VVPVSPATSATGVTSNLRDQLLAAAIGLLDEAGMEAVTIRDVARRCGVSHGAPRRHYATRTALLGHVAKDIADELAAELGAEGDPQRIAETYLLFASSRPHAFDLLMRHDLLEGSGARLRSSTTALVELWRRAWLRTHPDASDRDALATLVAVHGIASLVAHGAAEALDLDPAELLAAVVTRPTSSRRARAALTSTT
jgi:AcrR family transcriptional regulator